jgi:hypothetical protein
MASSLVQILATIDDQPYNASFGSGSSSGGPTEGQSTTLSPPSTTKRKGASTGANSIENRSTTCQAHRPRTHRTMQCLSGLKQRRRFDPSCPHHTEHQRASACEVRNLITIGFRQQVRCQSGSTLDRHCTPLDVQGSSGAYLRPPLLLTEPNMWLRYSGALPLKHGAQSLCDLLELR